MASGLVNVIEALVPKTFAVLDWMEQFLPFHVSEHSRMLLMIAGFLQLVLSRGLFRGKRAAWTLCLILFVLSPLLHLGRAFDWHHAIIQGFLAAALITWRKNFQANSDGPSVRWAFLLGVSGFALILMFGMMGLGHFSGEIGGVDGFRSNLWTVLDLIFTQHAESISPQTLRSRVVCTVISEAVFFFGVIVLFLLLKPVLPGVRHTEAERGLVKKLIDRHGSDSLDGFALLPDKRYHFFGEGEETSITAFAMWRDIAVTLSAPIGPRETLPAAVADFARYCGRQDWLPVFYEVPRDSLPAFPDPDFRTFRVSEEACIDLASFTLAGGKFQDFRTARNKMRKSGWRCERFAGDALSIELSRSLEVIAAEWLANHREVSMTFDLGSFAPASLDRADIFVLFDEKELPIAFVSWLPFKQGTGRSLDLIRYGSNRKGVMDLLLVESLLDFQSRGLREASLGCAPLANIEDPSADSTEEKGMRYLFERFDGVYGYKSLFEFKRKFAPIWRGRQVAYPGLAYLVPAVTAIAYVHLPAGLVKYLRS